MFCVITCNMYPVSFCYAYDMFYVIPGKDYFFLLHGILIPFQIAP